MARKKKIDRTFLCMDCQVDTTELDEYYMLRDEVWFLAVPEHDGMLCVECVEARLGRQLSHSDFLFAPINIMALFHGSERLKQRMDAAAMLTHSLADMPLGDLAFGLADAIATHQQEIEAAINKSKEVLN